MKKRCTLLAVIALLLVSSALAYTFETWQNEKIYEVDLGTLMFEEDILEPGDTASLRVSLAPEDENLKKVRISVEIWELGIYETTGPMRIREAHIETLKFEIPFNTVPGIYDVRITIEDSKKDGRRVKYRDLLVI